MSIHSRTGLFGFNGFKGEHSFFPYSTFKLACWHVLNVFEVTVQSLQWSHIHFTEKPVFSKLGSRSTWNKEAGDRERALYRSKLDEDYNLYEIRKQYFWTAEYNFSSPKRKAVRKWAEAPSWSLQPMVLIFQFISILWLRQVIESIKGLLSDLQSTGLTTKGRLTEYWTSIVQNRMRLGLFSCL